MEGQQIGWPKDRTGDSRARAVGDAAVDTAVDTVTKAADAAKDAEK